MAAGLSIDAALGRLNAARNGAGASALGVFAVRIGAAGFAYVAQVLMARIMGSAEYGIFAAVWVWIAILGHSATFGLSQGACRFLPADRETGRFAAMRGFLVGGSLASLFGAIAIAVLGLLVLRAEGSLLAGPFSGPILVGTLVLPLFALQDYLEGVARSQNWAMLAIAPPYLLRQGLIMAAMIVAVAAGAPAEAWVAVACTLLATGLSTLVQAVLLLARLRRVVPAGTRAYHWREWLTACLPIAAGDFASAAFGFIDVVLLGLLVSPAAVGLYFAATRIQQFVVFVHYAASAATAQRYSAAQARGDHEGLDRLVRNQSRWTFAATLLVGAAVVAAAPLLLGMFGPEFRAGLPIVAILVAGSIAASLFGPGEDILTMLGGERLCAAITFGMLLLGSLITLALVPWLGPIGAALAMAFVNGLRGLAMAIGVRRIHGIATPVYARIGAAR